jgi:hypothetical protein
MSLKSDLLRLYEAEKAAARGALQVKDLSNFRLFYGRVQGLERAMSLVGIEYTPISQETGHERADPRPHEP